MGDFTKKPANSIHQPVDEKFLLEQLKTMSPSELTHALEQALDTMTEETYDAKLIDAYLDALNQKEPMPEIPSVEDSYNRFQQHLRAFSSDSTAQTALPSARKHPRRFQRIWRTALVAAALAACIFGGMIAAQAAGVDVFGAMARWTKGTFSFGPVQTGSMTYESHDDSLDNQTPAWQVDDYTAESEYSSLQEALDACHITEVTAPTWIPEGYMLDQVDVFFTDDPETLAIDATYIANGKDHLIHITISSYTNEPSMQVEKTETLPETFDTDGITFYMIENTRNYTMAWLTENFECYIAGAINMEPEVLKEIVYSMF